MDAPPPPYYEPILPFSGNCDRKQHYECRLPSTAINMSVYTRAGTGGDNHNLPDDAFLNISYNFMTPVDADNTRYFWFQHRNSDPDNQEISNRMFEGGEGRLYRGPGRSDRSSQGYEDKPDPPHQSRHRCRCDAVSQDGRETHQRGKHDMNMGDRTAKIVILLAGFP